jgi:hypothetical protein
VVIALVGVVLLLIFTAGHRGMTDRDREMVGTWSAGYGNFYRLNSDYTLVPLALVDGRWRHQGSGKWKRIGDSLYLADDAGGEALPILKSWLMGDEYATIVSISDEVITLQTRYGLEKWERSSANNEAVTLDRSR